jgi:heat shock protein HslJ
MTIPRRPLASSPARLLLLVTVGTLAVAACSDDYAGTSAAPLPEGTEAVATTASGETTTSAGPADAAALAGRTFLSTQVDGEDLVAGTQITLTFDESAVGANGGCNTMSGGYEVKDDRLEVRQLAQTQMLCEDQYMAQDTWLADLLTGSPKIELSGSVLTLSRDGTTVVFADRVSLSPQNRFDDTSWLIESLETNGTTTQAPDGAEMSFADGSVSVVTGCNNASGSADVHDETITFGPMVTTLRVCEADLQKWQDDLLGFLQDTVVFETDGDNVVLVKQGSRLTLTPLI